MNQRNFFVWFVAFISIAQLAAIAQAGITLRLPDITVHPGESGTFDAIVEFNGSLPPPPPFYQSFGFRVWGYEARVVADPTGGGFRMPSAAGGLLGAGTVTESGSAIRSENGVYCVAIFPPPDGCPPAYSSGPHLLLRPDFQINPNVAPGTQYSLSFDLSKTHVTDYYGQPYKIDSVVGGSVTVAPGSSPILGGPIGPADFPGRTIVEDFNLGLTSPVHVPLVVSNAVITTSTGVDLNYGSEQYYTFGPAIAQRSNYSIIADFTVDTLRAGAWVGSSSFEGVTASFYSGETLLGKTTIHRVYHSPVFVGYESHAGLITRAVFTGLSSGLFKLDRLTTDAQPGDFNGDGNVDAADYTVWRNSMGHAGAGLAADGTGPNGVPDGVVDGLDYALWRSNYGDSASARAAALVESAAGQSVPEPGALALSLLAAMPLLMRRPTR